MWNKLCPCPKEQFRLFFKHVILTLVDVKVKVNWRMLKYELYSYGNAIGMKLSTLFYYWNLVDNEVLYVCCTEMKNELSFIQTKQI
jgi:hypothetical protein